VKTLEWHGFADRIELRAPGCSKSRVVEGVLATTPGDMPCAYLGDDLGDERAVAAVRDRGIWVLVRPEPRISGADYRLSPPDQLIAFLRSWHHACGGAA
jgi:trehalose 6-phosphate phosphatase